MSQAGDELRRVADRAENRGGRAAAKAMGDQAARDIRSNLGHRSHARGTPTPSPPGQPPARISGTLQHSVRPGAPRSLGGGRWSVYVGPHGVIYAAIQQHGGRAGRHHASDLPPRPYMNARLAEIARAGSAAFYRAVWG